MGIWGYLGTIYDKNKFCYNFINKKYKYYLA